MCSKHSTQSPSIIKEKSRACLNTFIYFQCKIYPDNATVKERATSDDGWDGDGVCVCARSQPLRHGCVMCQWWEDKGTGASNDCHNCYQSLNILRFIYNCTRVQYGACTRARLLRRVENAGRLIACQEREREWEGTPHWCFNLLFKICFFHSMVQGFLCL